MEKLQKLTHKKYNIKITRKIKYLICQETERLIEQIANANNNSQVTVYCIDFYNNYQPEKGHEVATYPFKFIVNIENTYSHKTSTSSFSGFVYDDGIEKLPIMLFSKWMQEEGYKCYPMNLFD